MAHVVEPLERPERTVDSIEARLAELTYRAKRVTALEYARLNPLHTSAHEQIDAALDDWLAANA